MLISHASICLFRTKTIHLFISRLFHRSTRTETTPDLKNVQQVHAHLLVNGLQEDDTLLADAILHVKHDCYYHVLYCLQLFDCICSPLVSSWNSMIRLCSNSSLESSRLLLLYRAMQRGGHRPDHLTFPFLLKGLTDSSMRSDVICIHAHVVKWGFLSDIFVQTSLMSLYAKHGYMEFVRQLFDDMRRRDIASWNVLIGGYSQKGCRESVFAVFQQMRMSDFSPDCVSLIGLMQSCVGKDRLRVGESVHCLVAKNGMESGVSVKNTLIAMYGKCGDSEAATLLLGEVDVSDRTTVSWNAVISGYCFQQDSARAVTMLNRMLHSGGKPDLGTVLSLVSCFGERNFLPVGRSIHSYVFTAGFDSNVSAANAIVSMYSKCGDIWAAYQVFREMSVRNHVSWTAMVSGFTRNGCWNEARKLFDMMETSGEKLDAVTIVAVLCACSISGDLEYGRWIHNYARTNGLIRNVIVCNALLDMYTKCGSMDDACCLFRSMPEKNVVSWTTMIWGYAMNGMCTVALEAFSHMLKVGLKPNHITFLAVLSACVHAGSLEEGLNIFYSLSSDHHIIPQLEHYACVVDLLGRRGKIREALDLVRSMPCEPDAGIWASLLGACRTHREIEMGEFITEKLLQLDPTAVSHVSMANIYAAGGKWEDMARLRVEMRSTRAKKSPGCSLVQANNKVHSFSVDDRSHSECVKIYEVLDGLGLNSKTTVYSEGNSEIQEAI